MAPISRAPISRIRADLLLLLVAFIWGSAFIAQSAAMRAGVAFLFNGITFLLGAVALLPLVRRPWKPAPGQKRWMLAAGILLFGGSALQQYGLYFTQVANAGFLTVLNVIFVPLLLLFIFREKPRLLDWVAVALAVSGAYLLSTNGSGLKWQLGDLLEIAGAVFWAGHVVLIGKVGGRFPSLSFACGQFLVCGLLNLSLGLALEDARSIAQLDVVAGILYRGLLSIGIGYTMQVWVQKFTSPTDAVLIFSLESVFAAGCAWALLSERLGHLQILGCGFILIAAFFPQLTKRPGDSSARGNPESSPGPA